MAVAREARPIVGSTKPRLAPPIPARSDAAAYCEMAAGLGISLMPWQKTAARYLEALGHDDRHLYREVAIVVSRQNGKTELLVPLIVKRLLAGKRIMHTAQDRRFPLEVFYRVADILWEHYAHMFPLRNGRPTKPRYSSGQEEIRLSNGGVYSIVAPNRGGARGPTRDLVIVDELREMDTWDFIAAAKPTLTVSPDPQIVYLSNAGSAISLVLNAVRDRRETDPALAYLEWSASPELGTDDLRGWAESNPAMGHEAEGMGSLREYLEGEHRTAKLEGTMGLYEVEHLTRWVTTTRESLVLTTTWTGAEVSQEELGTPVNPVMAVSMDPAGKRASAVIAWVRSNGTVGLRLILDVTGSPIRPENLGVELRDKARELGVLNVGFDPLTDALLAKFFRRTKSIVGQEFSNASAAFVTGLESNRIRWHDSAAIGADLSWTTRKPNDERGSFEAVRADDNRPIPAALAAIRAVWLATKPAAFVRQPQKVGIM